MYVFLTHRKTVHRNNAGIIGHLADQGADVDISRDDGDTPLQVVAEDGNVEIIRIFLDNGADVNKTVSFREFSSV